MNKTNPTLRTASKRAVDQFAPTVTLGGTHSALAGLRNVAMKTRALGHTAAQLLLGDGRDYNPMEASPELAEEYRKLAFGVATIIHLPYVINPCEDSRARAQFYRVSTKKYLEAAQELGATSAVLHPGFKKELTHAKAAQNLLEFLDAVEPLIGGVQLLLETDAGSKNGSAIGSPEFIGDILGRVNDPRFGMCADTTHLYARGIDLWDEPSRRAFISAYGHWIRLVHLNVPDLDVTLGSHRDRHNSPFESRPEWDHGGLIRTLIPRYPSVLERRSLAIQEQDTHFIRALLAEDSSK